MSSVTPWKPATTTTLPWRRASRMRSGLMSWMRAREWWALVRTPACRPESEIAGTPMPSRHIATSGAVIVSPLATSMSSSRAGGKREDAGARTADGRSVSARLLRSVHDVLRPWIEVKTMWLVDAVTKRLIKQRRPLGCDRTDEQRGTRRRVNRGIQRHRVGQYRAGLLGRHRGVGDENRQPPTRVGQPLVELLGDDADSSRGRCGHVVEVPLIG